MAFTNDEVGLLRGATKCALSLCEPQIANRNRIGTSDRLTLHLACVTDAEATILKTLAGENRRVTEYALSGAGTVIEFGGATPDGSGVVTVKIVKGAATTISCAFIDYELTEMMGFFPESAPTSIRYWTAEIQLLRL